MRAAVLAGGILAMACLPARGQSSVARQWDEANLNAIRIDTPRPPVHARNLYHLSAAMYDAWATYDTTARGEFFNEKHVGSASDAARNEAISYAAYRILNDRYKPGIANNAATSQLAFTNLMTSLGYDPNNTTTVGDSPAAIGNRIAAQIISESINDGANQANNYADTTGWTPINVSMVVRYPTVTDQAHTPLADPNMWQRLYIDGLTSQNGQVQPSNLQGYVAPHWAPVTPFAMHSNSGPYSYSDIDPGPPPRLNQAGDAEYRNDALELIHKANSLDPTQSNGAQAINVSPSVYGNRALGTHIDQGYAVNPVTGQPYADNFVKQADHARVLAEFWADGPHSETPPGHWNVIANQVSDNPLTVKKIGGQGPVVSNLEWDVKMYLALNGATHDAAIAAWGVKREYTSARPITMIRYMAGKGQSSDANLPSYDPDGLPLIPDEIELITADSIADGGRHRNAYLAANVDHNGDFFPFFTESELVGKIAIHTWNGNPDDPANETGLTDWILGEAWLPYQMESFVTPAFPGYISGHSTFSRSAAEVLAAMTGSPYFPGGLMTQTFTPDYLKFEDGPSESVTLEWVSYFDAADEAGISRRWGGIHPEMDDLPARVMGSSIGIGAFRYARDLFAGAPEPSTLTLGLLAALVGLRRRG